LSASAIRERRPALRVKDAQPATEHVGRLSFKPAFQRCSTLHVEGRLPKDRVRERAKKETGAADEHWHLAALADFPDPLSSPAREFARTESLVRADQVQPEVGHRRPLLRRSLGGANVHLAVQLAGVHRDDFTADLARDFDSERCLPRGGCTHQCDHACRPKRRCSSPSDSWTTVGRP
jgi:hypothetical protein